MSSSSGAATTGRPPQIGRNSIYGPGFNDLDFRVARNIPIHDSIYLQFSADAFNLLNTPDHHRSQRNLLAVPRQRRHLRIVATVQRNRPAPARLTFQGCISPYSGTGLSAFGATSGTNNSLYNARQMQFAAKLFF